MTPDERQLLAGLFDRIRAASNTARDRDAEAFIADAVNAQPYAPYLLAQTVIVQEQALKAAASRLEELEARVKEVEAAGSGSFLGNIGKSIFGAAPELPKQSAPTASPWNRTGAAPQGMPGGAPQYGMAPPQQQGAAPWQQAQAPAAGGSFLKGALGTAAGVAGGVMLAHSLQGLFSGAGNSQHGIGSGLDHSNASGGDSALDSPASHTQANYGSGSDGSYADQGNDGSVSSAGYDSSDDQGNGGGDSDMSDV